MYISVNPEAAIHVMLCDVIYPYYIWAATTIWFHPAVNIAPFTSIRIAKL
jgi:hypothetical protein